MPTFPRSAPRQRRAPLRAALAVVALGAAAPPAMATHQAKHGSAPVIVRHDLERAFTDAGTTGTLVVRQSGHINRTVVVGPRRAALRILPSSTFKIPNSLIAIDRGVVSGPTQPFPGPNPNYLLDGKPLLPAVCEGDLTLQIAFQNSCIPIYQRIARQVGVKDYRRAVNAFGYGNRDVDGAAVDDFWLHGPFAISALEQVAFLERLRTGRLPASRRAIADVRAMLVTEDTPAGTVRGKTGYVFAQDGQPRRGWWVGSVERPAQISTFALNLDMARDDLIPARVAIGRQLLTELGAFSG